MDEAAKARMRAMLLDEVKAGVRGWYYVSQASGRSFRGSFLVEAAGPTDAWRLFHALGFWEEGCATSTTGPISDTVMATIPDERKWRKLTREEADSLGT